MLTANLADCCLEKTDHFPNYVSVNLIHLMLQNSESVINCQAWLKANDAKSTDVSTALAARSLALAFASWSILGPAHLQMSLKEENWVLVPSVQDVVWFKLASWASE